MQSTTSSLEQTLFPMMEGVRARTLAFVNFGLFKELLKLGTPRDKICATLCLNQSEFDYLVHLR